MSTQRCIYCHRTGDETPFSREHVIPKNIAGTLVLDDFVCKEDNDWLGTNVDTELLRLPETLQAFAALSLPHDRDGILRNHFQVLGELDGQILRGKITGGVVDFPMQKLPGGSLITPEEGLEGPLTKMAFRTGRPRAETKSELKRLVAEYRKAPIGSTITSKVLGITLARRSGQPNVRVVPKRQPRPERLIAKITNEFLFLVLGRHLFLPENAEQGEALHNTIADSVGPKAVVLRVKPEENVFKPLHILHFRNDEDLFVMHVVLFGSIDFVLCLPPLAVASLALLREQFVGGVVGIQFQQRLDRDLKAFWAVRKDAPARRIG